MPFNSLLLIREGKKTRKIAWAASIDPATESPVEKPDIDQMNRAVDFAVSTGSEGGRPFYFLCPIIPQWLTILPNHCAPQWLMTIIYVQYQKTGPEHFLP